MKAALVSFCLFETQITVHSPVNRFALSVYDRIVLSAVESVLGETQVSSVAPPG